MATAVTPRWLVKVLSTLWVALAMLAVLIWWLPILVISSFRRSK